MIKHIIFISMEACGASSLGPLISQQYEVFTGKRVYWNWEISRLLAIDNERVFPKGFSSVYYVDPKKVLERPFDKVILLQRPKEEIRRDIYDRLGIEFAMEEVDSKIDFYYDLIYNQEIQNDRLYRIDLREFNNYPVAGFSDLFDFLEFPKKYRIGIYPYAIWHHSEEEEYDPKIPVINRDWKKRSTILRKGHEEKQIEKNEYSPMVNVEKPNPYKLAPEEYVYQKGHTYRLLRKEGVMTDVLEVLKYI